MILKAISNSISSYETKACIVCKHSYLPAEATVYYVTRNICYMLVAFIIVTPSS